MKNITTVLILFFVTAFVSSAQSYNHEQLSRALKLKDIPKKISEYTASNGQVFKVGETLTFGTPMNENNVFAHIYGLDALGTATSFGIRDKGWEAEIIKFRGGGSKRMGFDVFAVCKTKSGVNRAYVNIEKALTEGEVVSTELTKAQAISQLKEAKELFDLEIMSKEEYDKIRAELTPIITGKK